MNPNEPTTRRGPRPARSPSQLGVFYDATAEVWCVSRLEYALARMAKNVVPEHGVRTLNIDPDLFDDLCLAVADRINRPDPPASDCCCTCEARVGGEEAAHTPHAGAGPWVEVDREADAINAIDEAAYADNASYPQPEPQPASVTIKLPSGIELVIRDGSFYRLVVELIADLDARLLALAQTLKPA